MLNIHENTGLDALLPVEMARKSESVGEKKANLDVTSTFVLAVLAGAFIALGGIFYTVVVTTGEVEVAFGIKKLLGGIAFSLGLILVVVAGAELFTGNNLIVVAWASRRVTTTLLLRNWLVVYLGNGVGAIGIAILVYFSQLDTQHSGAVGDTMLAIASSKCSLGWPQAIALGIGCNVLVCLAVWLCMSARSVTDKVFAILFPITAFVATGMEHCVANMYFVPAAMMIGLRRHGNGPTADPVLEGINLQDFIINNLIPVTIGNIIGGAVLVGLVYWFVYLRNEKGSDL
jgi:formate transporter